MSFSAMLSRLLRITLTIFVAPRPLSRLGLSFDHLVLMIFFR
jgi:hypothetical protein